MLVSYRTIQRKHPTQPNRKYKVKEVVCKCDFCKKKFYHLTARTHCQCDFCSIKYCSKECKKKYSAKNKLCSIKNCTENGIKVVEEYAQHKISLKQAKIMSKWNRCIPLHKETTTWKDAGFPSGRSTGIRVQLTGGKLCRSHLYHYETWGLDKNGESKRPKCILCLEVVQVGIKRKFSKRIEKQISEILIKSKKVFRYKGQGKSTTKMRSGYTTVGYKKVCDKCYPKYLRNKITKRLGSVCKCCGENEPLFLQIDHIKGGGNKERKKFNNIDKRHGSSSYYEFLVTHPDLKKKYQLLCANCNIGRYLNGGGFKNGVCPHKSLTLK